LAGLFLCPQWKLTQATIMNKISLLYNQLISMKKTVSKLGLILLISALLLTACSPNTKKEGWTDYENEKLGIKLSHPQAYTLEENEKGITIYHFKEQPVPFFTITVYEAPIKDVIGQLQGEVVENDTDDYTLTTFSDELQKDIDTRYLEENDKTHSFSCYAGLYDDICETIKFTN